MEVSARERRRFLGALALGLVLVAGGCGGSESENPPGNPAVYSRIAATTDCADLQAEFDQAMENVERYPAGDDRRETPLAYAKAADDRMGEVGCYD